MWTFVAVVLAGYLIGSVPFPLWVSRLVAGIDLREHGTGNMGATNAARVLGKRWFPLVFGLDAVKGAGATLLAKALLPAALGIDPLVAAAIGGAAACVGHCFPIFVRFKGGVGLAASAGALLAVSPLWLLVALAGIGVLWLLSRNMYVGVSIMALIWPLLGWWAMQDWIGVAATALWGWVVLGLHLVDIKTYLAGRKAG